MKNLIRRVTTIILFLAFFVGSSQNTISGFVFSGEEQKPLIGATIVLRNPENNVILKYDITDNKGRFSIILTEQEIGFLMEVTYLGYKKWTKFFEKSIKETKIELEPSPEALDEIVLEGYAIEQKKDTISYNINQLKKSSDLVISDVIKRLPGIEVKPTGEIFYQGRPINKYYIEGLDLLEGKYNLANENLSVNSVLKVEILENHQPIRVLDSVEVSDRAALNIKLKNNVTATGTATAAIGWDINPLWQVNLTPILFSKNKQFLGSYQTNNVGDEILSQTRDFFQKEEARSPINPTAPNKPPFDKQFWLDNISHLGSVNFLTRNKEEVDHKFSLSYSNAKQVLNGTTQTNYFFSEDSVEVRERILSNHRNARLQGNYTIEKNTEKTYLRHEIVTTLLWHDTQGDISRESDINEFLDDTSYSIGQSLTKIIPLGKYIFDFKTNNSLKNQDLLYEVSPAQFLEQLQGQDSSSTLQAIENNIFKSYNSIGIRRDFGFFKMNSKVGFDFLGQRFNTAINPTENRLDLTNNIDYNNSSFYIHPGINFKNKVLEGSLNLPIRKRSLRFNLIDESEFLKESFTNFEPSGWFKLIFNNFWNGTYSFSVNNRFGNSNSIYPNFVITNYRNIQRFNGLIPREFTKEYEVTLNYRNPLMALFGSAGYSRVLIRNNLIYASSIDENGFLEVIAIPELNDIENEKLSFSIGKRISGIKTIVNVGGDYVQNVSNRIVNESPILVNNDVLNYRFSWDTDISSFTSFYLKGNFQFIKGNIDGSTVSEIRQQEFNSTILLNINENSYFNISNVLFRAKPRTDLAFQNTTFLNIEYFYKLKKKKIDFFVKWQNILNSNNYVSSGFDENFSNLSSFQIRPSQFLFGWRLSL